jgi:hypothetical protein
MAFGDADRVIVFFEGVNGAKCTAGIVGSVIIQDGRVSDQQIQPAVPVFFFLKKEAHLHIV